MEIRLATVDHCADLARLHARCFEELWDPDTFWTLLQQPNTFALLANETHEEEARGFVVLRIAADESEILTLGIAPEYRCRGMASKLVLEAAELANSKGATHLFLEVGLDNSAATKLYRTLGFEQVGVRQRYYQRPGAPAEDACILRAGLPLALSA